MQTDNRPLSPFMHYKQGWTGIPSILHRITGIVLSVGSLFLVYWLIALATGPAAYETARSLFGSVIGQVGLFVFTFALFYHMCNGIRHLIWDAVIGLELQSALRSARVVIGASVVLTLLTWILYFVVGGA